VSGSYISPNIYQELQGNSNQPTNHSIPNFNQQINNRNLSGPPPPNSPNQFASKPQTTPQPSAQPTAPTHPSPSAPLVNSTVSASGPAHQPTSPNRPLNGFNNVNPSSPSGGRTNAPFMPVPQNQQIYQQSQHQAQQQQYNNGFQQNMPNEQRSFDQSNALQQPPRQNQNFPNNTSNVQQNPYTQGIQGTSSINNSTPRPYMYNQPPNQQQPRMQPGPSFAQQPGYENAQKIYADMEQVLDYENTFDIY
jgi:hypothetical protein